MINKSKHTPGPWGTEYDGSIVMGSQIVSGPIGPDSDTAEVRKANSALIAAAPELLAELNELREFFYGKYGYGNDDEQIKRLRLADAVLAKATGG